MPLSVVNGIMLSMISDEMPAVAYLKPVVMHNWPINPMLHMMHNPMMISVVSDGGWMMVGMAIMDAEHM